MKIQKEDFNKLNQLDRIEYRQKHRLISEKYDSSISIYFFLPFIIFSIFICAFFIIKDITGLINNTLYDIALVSSKFTLLFLIFEWTCLFFNIHLKHKYLKKLNEEYFKQETKIK